MLIISVIFITKYCLGIWINFILLKFILIIYFSLYKASSNVNHYPINEKSKISFFNSSAYGLDPNIISEDDSSEYFYLFS